jgi:hypothetical protein
MALWFGGLASLAAAQGPESLGSVDMGAVYTTPYSPSGYGTPYVGDGLRLDWGLPVSAGLGLRGDFRWFSQGSTYSGFDYFYHAKYSNDFTSDDYAGDLLLDLYVAGLRGRPFVPGQGANADGWLGRLSFTLGLHFEDANLFDTQTVSSPVNQVNAYNQYQASYGVVTGMTLPLAAWISIGGSWSQGLYTVQAYSNTGDFANDPTYRLGGGSAVDLFAHFYLNLARGAGEDTARPFVPHYGRLGQLMVGLGAERQQGDIPGSPGMDSYRLTLGVPLIASVALGADFIATNQLIGGARYTNVTDYPTQTTLHLAMAFGAP